MGKAWIPVCAFVAMFILFGASGQGPTGEGPFDWMNYDKFDEITERMSAVNPKNCKSKPATDLHLPEETLAQLPRFNKLLSMIIYPNRTNLLHLHNMALNRAFYYSYMYQKLNETHHFPMQPGMMYYYFSAAADVSANEYGINGSAVFFDNNATYANWYRNLPFNTTLPLFGPRAWRLDDYNDPTNWLREPTNSTIQMVDYGAGPQSNYTHKSYKINEWYNLWLPDGWERQGQDSVRKYSYDVGIMYSNATGKFVDNEFKSKVFFGPPSPGQKEKEHLPVVFTQPYYDCGRSNKWIVSAVSPIVDQIPRYLEWFHLRRYRFVASASMDMDFLSVDMNQCPFSIGNEPPNYFAGTDRCKPSTMCEPKYGWGFRRGGYQCVCKPGYRYPPWQSGPFQGSDIESATGHEYTKGFECYPVGLRIVIPIIRGNESGTPDYDPFGRKRRSAKDGDWYQPKFARRVYLKPSPMKTTLQSRILNKKQRLLRSMGLWETTHENEAGVRATRIIARQSPLTQPKTLSQMKSEARKQSEQKRKKVTPRYKRDTSHHRSKRQAFDTDAYTRMENIINHKFNITKKNCKEFKNEDLYLPGDVAFGVEKQFSPQARTALRLSHFLSNFLQNIDRYEEYGNLRGDNFLNVEQLFGEVIANVMGDLKIKGSGVFWDIDKYEEQSGRFRQFFGPYAYRYEEESIGGPEADRANTHFRAIDFAGFPDHYLDKEWFRHVKERWQSNTYGLEKFTEKPMIRSDLAGSSLKRFEMYPMYYRAPREEDGWWSAPYFNCDSYVNEWIITYSIPFFGLNSIRSALEFKGVVTVDVKLDELDINQCPAAFYVPNAFKGTARCHFENTYCEFLPSKKFVRGAYKCECLQGYEYPYNDRAWYYDGQTMEEEYRKLFSPNEASRYHTLKCRIAGASRAAQSWIVLALLAVVHFLSQGL